MIDAERIWNPDDNLLAGEGAIPHDLTLDFFAPVVENPTPFAGESPRARIPRHSLVSRPALPLLPTH